MRNLFLICLMVIAGTLMSVNLKAENDENKVIVKGILIVTMEDGVVSKAVLKKVEKVEDEEIVTLYVIKLDDNSTKMAKELKDKEVEIEGVIAEVEKGDDIENQLTVKTFKASSAAKDAEKVDVDLD